MKIKKNDKVQVITGKDKGKTGIVKQVLFKSNQLVIEGINLSTKHKKPSQVDQGGLVKKEMPIHYSNVMVLDGDSKVSKIGFKFLEDGTKIRFFKSNNENMNN